MKKRAEGMLADCSSPSNSGVTIAPKVGRLALWYNYHADGRFDPSTIHAGCAVKAGEKFAANIWLAQLGGLPLFHRAAGGGAGGGGGGRKGKGKGRKKPKKPKPKQDL